MRGENEKRRNKKKNKSPTTYKAKTITKTEGVTRITRPLLPFWVKNRPMI